MGTNSKDLRVGVVGVGTMGRHHVRIISESTEATLAGFHETDRARAKEFSSTYGCPAYESLDELLDNTDAVCVAAPTSLHAEIGEKCLASGVHLLMEKPLAHSLEAATRLVEKAHSAGVVLMAGHVERYNPAIRELIRLLEQRKEPVISVDTRRLAPFDGSRCLDVDVLYDLLIHDVDLVLEITDSTVVRVSAAGRPVFSGNTDVAYSRIDFTNNASAVLCVGKCSPKKVRSINVSTRTRLYETDTLNNSLVVHVADRVPSTDPTVCFMRDLRVEEVPVPDHEPLKAELEDFFTSVKESQQPIVDGRRALKSMQAIDLIQRAIETGHDIYPD
ncbi:Gfo/Idh/MocA family protein [Thermodesulfobacteriota bacterium]